ncbi:GNAT family N-acetyltransferase [Salinimonas lutimaris]|uniref:GNAT family N-acetyltransferase n=1 Tax=Salinimonas lutimaris TaxID=914153 RepID=UPI0010C09E5D|nr:GNAT family N-acetyltransferase [Salinimonas lutimaris]
MAFANLFDWIKQRAALADAQRQILVLSTDTAVELAEDVIQHHSTTMTCWLGETTSQTSAFVQRPTTLYKQVLGQEFDLVVYNTCDGFRPSALLALSGTVKQGGLCIVITPPLPLWHEHSSVTRPHHLSHGYTMSHSRYIRQLSQTMLSDENIAVIDEQCVRLPPPKSTTRSPANMPGSLTSEQQQVFTNIIRDIQHNLPLTALTALRGRGKSTVLGFIAGYLTEQGMSVALTSPIHQTQQVFFDALGKAVKQNRGLMDKVSWLAPDHSLLLSGQYDVLLVDEAAALPQPVLSGYLAANRQVVVSSTTVGFEGSGHGFIYKFLQPRLQLGQASHYQLHTAMRWQQEDTMERWLHRALFIDAVEHAADNTIHEQSSPVAVDPAQLQINCWRPEAISPDKLRTLFSLLSHAHYQTTPEDFMRMMDAPDGLFFVAHIDDEMVGAAVVTIEGGERLAALAHDIACGKRRIKGHLSAQSAASLIVEPTLATHQYWRVGRIATASAFRGQGVGTSLLKVIRDNAIQYEVDWLATSFGHTHQLEQFWQHSGFWPARLGQKADKASGLVSLLMLQSLSARSAEQRQALSEAYQLDQGHYQTGSQSALVSAIVTRRLNAFCRQTLALEQTGNALPCYIAGQLRAGKDIPSILKALYLDMLTDQVLLSTFSLSGKKALNEAIRAATLELLQTSQQ